MNNERYTFVISVHTMEELKLTGNHLKGSRPILTFSSKFDKDAHWKLLKEMITQVHWFCFFLRNRKCPDYTMFPWSVYMYCLNPGVWFKCILYFFLLNLLLRYLEFRRSTASLSLIMIMSSFSLLLMTTFGSETIRYWFQRLYYLYWGWRLNFLAN